LWINKDNFIGPGDRAKTACHHPRFYLKTLPMPSESTPRTREKPLPLRAFWDMLASTTEERFFHSFAGNFP
jgi:hypothetical protein